MYVGDLWRYLNACIFEKFSSSICHVRQSKTYSKTNRQWSNVYIKYKCAYIENVQVYFGQFTHLSHAQSLLNTHRRKQAREYIWFTKAYSMLVFFPSIFYIMSPYIFIYGKASQPAPACETENNILRAAPVAYTHFLCNATTKNRLI